ncbi:hypothetical protein [Marixanthomonas spongiae]|uniref:Lipoprotein n=1 Tax=Marixanthomonas spongiae TaxID=2174845 RepID=A0A2U0HTG6_9FLAO|nr:hypothetical protein [Marixanthomonas spongiae]PVW12162.1 hypothetical protein DDV96_15285 [Marixanthomonas spongiae]
MKAFFLLLPLLIINACNTAKTTTGSSPANETGLTENSTPSCPEGGTCTVEVLQNKQLVLKEDGIGALYPEITNGDNLVVVYTFFQKGPAGTVDGNYTETIHFEIPATLNELYKKDASLQDVTLLYEKQCYCKGEAGFYKVKNGTLQLTKTNGELHFNLQFTVDETSHKLSNISRAIQL